MSVTQGETPALSSGLIGAAHEPASMPCHATRPPTPQASTHPLHSMPEYTLPWGAAEVGLGRLSDCLTVVCGGRQARQGLRGRVRVKRCRQPGLRAVGDGAQHAAGPSWRQPD